MGKTKLSPVFPSHLAFKGNSTVCMEHNAQCEEVQGNETFILQSGLQWADGELSSNRRDNEQRRRFRDPVEKLTCQT